jgi:hypothetical protein
MLENIFGRHMPLQALLEDFQNLLPRNGGLQSSAFEFVHEFSGAIERERLWQKQLRRKLNAAATMT